MKKTLLILAAVGLAPVAFAQVVTPLHNGDSVLIAGFGFEALPYNGFSYGVDNELWGGIGNLYTDFYAWGDASQVTFNDPPFASNARIYWDGSHGSTYFDGETGLGGASGPAVGGRYNFLDTANEDVNSVRRTTQYDEVYRVGLDTLTPQLGNPYMSDNALDLRFSSGSTFSIVVDTAIAGANVVNGGISAALTSLTFGASARALDDSGSAAMIAWSYQIGAGPVQSLGSTSVNDVFSAKTVSFAGAGFTGGETITIFGTLSGAVDTILTLDNVQLLGSVVEPLVAIPEPSTYAGLAGIAMLGLAAIRRRKVVC